VLFPPYFGYYIFINLTVQLSITYFLVKDSVLRKDPLWNKTTYDWAWCIVSKTNDNQFMCKSNLSVTSTQNRVLSAAVNDEESFPVGKFACLDNQRTSWLSFLYRTQTSMFKFDIKMCVTSFFEEYVLVRRRKNRSFRKVVRF
jgi:hypothetical protein